MSTTENTTASTTANTTASTTANTTAPKAKVDPAKEMISVVIPRRYARERSRTIVANGEYRRFPVGREVKMPRPFYENLKRSESQRQRFEKMVDKLVEDTGKVE